MFMGVFWILIIIGLLFFFMKWFSRNSRTGPLGILSGEANSMEILKERYARGEIDRKEFEQKKHDLENAGV